MYGNNPGYDAPAEPRPPRGIRTELINSYDIPRYFYAHTAKSAAKHMSTLGCMIRYSLDIGCTGRRKRTPMDVDALVTRWEEVIVGLAIAHDKDEADRYEAAIETCLTPILSAPIKQVREFYPKLLARMKANKSIPFLVWRSYEIWIEQVLDKAVDEDVKQLKRDLAREITEMVEQDVKDQIPDQMIRALMWRSGETLQEVKVEVQKVKEAGGKVRLRGRESCLFLEVGGTEDEPKVCVQI